MREKCVCGVTRCVVTLALSLATLGCASLVHGTTQVIPVTSDPPGALVTVDSVVAGRTPLVTTMRRGAEHVVRITYDTFPTATRAVQRSLSPWLLVDIGGYFAPLAVDFYTGGAYNLRPDSVHALFTKRSNAYASATLSSPLTAGLRLHFESPDGSGGFVEGIADSLVRGRLYLSPTPDSAASVRGRVAQDVRTLRRLAVYQAPDGAAAGMRGLRTGVQWLSPFALLGPAGAFFPVLAMPVGYGIGYVAAEPRWSPLETFGAKSPLLADDRLRWTTRTLPATATQGRLFDIDSAALVIRGDAGMIRVPRGDVRTLQRADGYDYGRGALYGIAGGLIVGGIVQPIANYNGRNNLSLPSVLGAYALVGLLISPAFAPTHWSDVLRW